MRKSVFLLCFNLEKILKVFILCLQFQFILLTILRYILTLSWNEKGGYRIGIKSKNGNYYYYAHLDSYEQGIEKGKEISAGDTLGYMGNTGYSKVEGTKGNFEVHLHMGIEVETSLTKNELWINPYPFLSLIENSQKNSSEK